MKCSPGTIQQIESFGTLAWTMVALEGRVVVAASLSVTAHVAIRDAAVVIANAVLSRHAFLHGLSQGLPTLMRQAKRQRPLICRQL